MADTPKPGETEVAPSNGQAATVTPEPIQTKEPDNGGGSEAEKLKEELQKQARANQLANQELEALRKEKEEREAAEAKAKAKQLEEKEEFKTLYEQERARREEFEQQQAEAAHKAEVAKVADQTLAEYSDEVKAIAEDTGLSLTDDSEEAVNSFKERLDKIQARIGDGQRVRANNPGTSSPKKEYTREEMYTILNDPVKRDEYYRNKGGVAASVMSPTE